jgi:hypothetical protein
MLSYLLLKVPYACFLRLPSTFTAAAAEAAVPPHSSSSRLTVGQLAADAVGHIQTESCVQLILQEAAAN